MSRRDFLQLSAGAAAGLAVAGCASGPGAQPQSSEAPEVAAPAPERVATVPDNVMELPNAALGIPYEIKESINGGNPITLEYWEWALDRYEYEQRWAEEYMQLYPNVTINVSNQAWEDYWTKLTVNVPAGQGPAIWHMHTSLLTEFCDGQLMDPIPAYIANQEFLDEHWIGFAEGAMECPTGTPGSRHFLPMGIMLPVMYINARLWEEAGLSDADIPTTWDELREVGKALTKTDSAGRIIQSGLQANWQEWLQSAVYQQGRYLFTADGKKAQINNDEYFNAVEFIRNVFEVDKLTDPEFPDELEAFASEQTAITLGFSWRTSTYRRNNPDLAWFAALAPTPDGSLPPAYGNLRFAVEAVVNPFAPPEVKEVAWDFWHFLYSDDKRVTETIALGNGFIPPYDKLVDQPVVQADQVASVLAQGVEYGIINDMPEVVRNVIEQVLLDQVLLTDIPIRDALAQAEEAANAELAQRENWNIIERNYKHDDLMIPNQP